MLVGTLSKRVNLRVDEETFEAYNKVASFFNRSIADFMREALQGGIPTMETLGAMIDRAKAGDGEAVQRLFDSMLVMHQGTMSNARERMVAELAFSSREESPDSNSDTVRWSHFFTCEGLRVA
jgi:predicted DNA-binding protein